MTAITKASVKAYFETGDRPTQAQFEDLVDSYQDVSQHLSGLVAAVSAGVSGLPYYTDASSVTMLVPGSAGRALVSAGTKASALSFLVDTASAGLAIVSASTKASVVSFLAPISASNFDTPWIGTLTSAAPVSADFVPFGDASDSNNQKRATVQNLLDLVPPAGIWEVVEVKTNPATNGVTLGEGNIAAGYDYAIQMTDVKWSADPGANNPRLQYGTGAGPTYQATGYVGIVGRHNGTTYTVATTPVATGICFTEAASYGGSVAGELMHGWIEVANPAANTVTTTKGDVWGHQTSAVWQQTTFSGNRTTAEVVTGLRIIPDGVQTADTGTFILYRRRRTV